MNIHPDNLRLRPEEEPHRQEIAEDLFQKMRENILDERLLGYAYPKTKDEWWALVDQWWPELKTITGMFLPSFPPQAVETMRTDRNPDLGTILESAWGNAPDHGSIHGIKGWGVLCDLCSECGNCLFPEPPEPEEG